MSDWGGVNERVAGLSGGTNLEMPGSGDYNTRKIVKAIQNGRLFHGSAGPIGDRSARRDPKGQGQP